MRDWRSYVRQRLDGLELSGPREAEIVEELALHLEASYEEALAAGAGPDEAFRRVAAVFPDWDALRRDLRRIEKRPGLLAAERTSGNDGWFVGVWQDVRYGLRSLLATPTFTAISLVTLAVGIGANAVIFSLVDGVLVRPLPYRDPDRLVLIRADVEGEVAIASLSAIELLDFRERARLFEDFAGIWASTAALTGVETPEQIRYAWSTRNLFPMMGVEPMLGRLFTAEEEASNGPPVVILSGELWQRRYGSDLDILGRSIEIDDQKRVVVGVLPPGFRLLLGADTDVSAQIEAWVPQTYWVNREMRWLRVIARLRPGVTLAQAQEEMDAVAENLEREYAEYAQEDLGFHVVALHGDLVRDVKPAMVSLFGAVGFLLLIVCTNVANLLLTKTRARAKEIAIRAALGASRARLIRQMLAESVLLAMLGGVLGIAAATICLTALPAIVPRTLPRLNEVALDGRVLLFTFAASLLTCFLFGVLPALRGSRLRPQEALKGGGRSSRAPLGPSLRDGLVVAEIALSFVLLMGAGLMVRTLVNLGKEDLGFDGRSILTMEVPLSLSKYDTPERQWSFHRALKERVGALPGVRSSGAVSLLPLSGGLFTSPYAYDAASERDFGSRSADYRTVVPGYFETMGARLVEGRFFSDSDSVSGRRFVIIDDTLARSAWPGERAVGKRVKVDLAAGVAETSPEWMDVVGVVKHLRHERVSEKGRPQIYFPIWMNPVARMALVIHADGDPEILTASVQNAVEELGSTRPVHTVHTMKHYVDGALSKYHFTLTLMLVFAGTALLLAAIGIYGVISFSVSQRTHELGIRVALGASARDVLEMVLGHGAILAFAGTAGGFLGTVLLGRFLESLVFRVATTDPVTFLGVGLLLLAVSLLACARPAWRGTRVDPTVALRHD